MNEDIPQWPEIDYITQTLNHLTKTNAPDIAIVMLCSSMLDELLRRIIDAYLVSSPTTQTLLESSRGVAPLATFSARIKAAFALGLISKHEMSKAEVIRKIRNEFAHKVQVSFESAEIKKRRPGLAEGNSFDFSNLSMQGLFVLVSLSIMGQISGRVPSIVKLSERKLT